jgi:Glu-tRNA(Gln) amidotransferase subunit E-like FAD-binding protein
MSYVSQFRKSVEVTGNKTLAATDSGIVQVVTATCTITLPAAAAGASGLVFTIVNGGEGATDGAVTVTIAPNAADKIVGYGLTAADNKYVRNTLGRGNTDYLTLVSVNEATTDSAYVVAEGNGDWVREA